MVSRYALLSQHALTARPGGPTHSPTRRSGQTQRRRRPSESLVWSSRVFLLVIFLSISNLQPAQSWPTTPHLLRRPMSRAPLFLLLLLSMAETSLSPRDRPTTSSRVSDDAELVLQSACGRALTRFEFPARRCHWKASSGAIELWHRLSRNSELPRRLHEHCNGGDVGVGQWQREESIRGCFHPREQW